MAMTKTRQQTVVGEGLAIGVISLGIDSVQAGSHSLNFSFSHAWKVWQDAHRFPQIRAGAPINDIQRILHKSESRQGHLAAWRLEQRAWPYIRLDNWGPDEVANVLDGEVTLDSWTELARLFVERATG